MELLFAEVSLAGVSPAGAAEDSAGNGSVLGDIKAVAEEESDSFPSCPQLPAAGFLLLAQDASRLSAATAAAAAATTAACAVSGALDASLSATAVPLSSPSAETIQLPSSQAPLVSLPLVGVAPCARRSCSASSLASRSRASALDAASAASNSCSRFAQPKFTNAQNEDHH